MRQHLTDALAHLQNHTNALRAALSTHTTAAAAHELNTLIRLAELQRVKLTALHASTSHAG
jgi:hypothetical protein